VVFTGGIGENSTLVRALVAEHLKVFGIRLDDAKNALPGSAGERVISTDSSRVVCAVIPTNEEKMIALDALRLGKVTPAAAYA
jgi:propionate kinase